MPTLQDLITLLTGRGVPQPHDAPLSYGELGTVKDPTTPGRVGTELMAGVNDPRLYGNRATNIPLLVKGQTNPGGLVAGQSPTPEQVQLAIRRAIERIAAGERFPNYATPAEADAGALQRHKILETLFNAGGQRLPMHRTPGQ